MAQDKAITMKVFFNNDARRFSVDESVCTSFVFMKEKLQAIFPTLRGNNFKIAWKDTDGDEITISSDEDLITAFTEMSANTKVLYVSNSHRGSSEECKFRGQQFQAEAGAQGCPFSSGSFDPKDMHALGAMARQYFGPLLESLNVPAQPGTANSANQEGAFMDIIRNAAEGFFGNQPGSSQQNKAEASSQQPTQQETSQGNTSSSASHQNPKVAEGLAQLEQMGFSNKNGLLTHLLECFHGDVSAVVKALADMKM